MIDHTGITVTDFEASKAFYDKAMAPLGASLLMMVPPEYTGGVKVGGYGRDQPAFWLHEGSGSQDRPAHRLHRAQPRRGRRLLRGGDRRRRQGQWRAGPAAALSSRTTTAPSSSIPTATISKPSATQPE